MATYSSIKKKKERKKENILLLFLQFSSVQTISHVQLFGTPWTAAHQATLSFTTSQSSLKFMSVESVMLSNHLILSHPFYLLLSIFPSIRVISSESALWHHVAKILELQFQHHHRLISFRIDWLDLLAVQGTLEPPAPQFQSINSSVLSLIYAPNLTSVLDYWENHNFEYTELCQLKKE